MASFFSIQGQKEALSRAVNVVSTVINPLSKGKITTPIKAVQPVANTLNNPLVRTAALVGSVVGGASVAAASKVGVVANLGKATISSVVKGASTIVGNKYVAGVTAAAIVSPTIRTTLEKNPEKVLASVISPGGAGVGIVAETSKNVLQKEAAYYSNPTVSTSSKVGRAVATTGIVGGATAAGILLTETILNKKKTTTVKSDEKLAKASENLAEESQKSLKTLEESYNKALLEIQETYAKDMKRREEASTKLLKEKETQQAALTQQLLASQQAAVSSEELPSVTKPAKKKAKKKKAKKKAKPKSKKKPAKKRASSTRKKKTTKKKKKKVKR